MKRIIFIMAAALCLAACNQNEPNQPIDPQNWSPVGKRYLDEAYAHSIFYGYERTLPDTTEWIDFMSTGAELNDDSLKDSTNLAVHNTTIHYEDIITDTLKIIGLWSGSYSVLHFTVNYPHILFYAPIEENGIVHIDTIALGYFKDTLTLLLDKPNQDLDLFRTKYKLQQ